MDYYKNSLHWKKYKTLLCSEFFLAGDINESTTNQSENLNTDLWVYNCILQTLLTVYLQKKTHKLGSYKISKHIQHLKSTIIGYLSPAE